MEIIKKTVARNNNPIEEKAPVIAFFGDSVTHGCFEVFNSNGKIDTLYDQESRYSTLIFNCFSKLIPKATINIINAGISGDEAPKGYERLKRDVISYNPDLTVVCFGLNDCMNGISKIDKYKSAIKNIFSDLKKAGSEIILLTPNMMCKYVDSSIYDENLKIIAGEAARVQNEGILDKYVEEAKKTASEFGIPICDVYSIWKKMDESGVDITNLLANKINHPTRDMHKLFAFELIRTMFEQRS